MGIAIIVGAVVAMFAFVLGPIIMAAFTPVDRTAPSRGLKSARREFKKPKA